MTTARIRGAYPRLPQAAPLPTATDQPRAAFLGGWWSGIVVGIVIGAGLAVVVLHGAR